MKKHIIYLIAILLTGSVCLAQPTTDDIVSEFFNILEERGSDQALDFLYGTNTWLPPSSEAVVNLKNSMRDLPDIVGEALDPVLLTKTSLGEVFELQWYLMKYDRQPMHFEFLFYKPRDAWVTYSFSYNDNLDEILVDLAAKELEKMTGRN
jgi:hypothetical protein